jgi:hypothetical protein
MRNLLPGAALLLLTLWSSIAGAVGSIGGFDTAGGTWIYEVVGSKSSNGNVSYTVEEVAPNGDIYYATVTVD